MKNLDGWSGYGDEACKTCVLIQDPALLTLCKAMVEYTKLQTAAAQNNDWGKAIRYEGLQNDIAGMLNQIEINGVAGNCEPGFNRI